MQSCKPVYSPALALPYELTSQIFVHCLPLHRRIRPCRGSVPMRLSQICGQWRDVALSTFQLWSSVHLNLAPRPQYDGISTLFDGIDPELVFDHTHDVLELWFTRAAGHPLSITIICAELGAGVPPEIMDLIAAHSANWGRVELQVTDADFQTFSAIPGPFPLLRSLAIQRTESYLEIHELDVLLHGSPNLSAFKNSPTLTMNPAHLDLLPTSLVALQSIRWSAGDAGIHLPMFERMPILRHLGAFNHGSWDVMDGGKPPTVVPSLLSLLVRGSPYFLDLIDTPALEYLGVELQDEYYSPSIRPIAAFLSRSRAWGQLTQLSLDVSSTHIGGVGLVECLAAVPTLTTLELVFPDARVRTQERYTFLQSADIVPRLRRLAITDGLHRDTFTPFLAVVRARPGLTHAELHMRTKHVHLRLTPARDVLRELEALVARGTETRIKTPNYAWPLYSEDDDVVGVLDHSVFELGSYQSRPHSFSSFC
ncbi:hypothetical protein B0H11DRAFT_1843511 [Mycena galericulata]|nr:hypothetical protein B0H11DRAFT_1843511 [Mycena galericulata]